MDDDLWMVEAVIQPFKLDAVSFALQEVPGFAGITISECQGYGRARFDGGGDPPGDAAVQRARETDLVEFRSKLKVEAAVVGRATADRVVETIARAARTGRAGDGKVFLWPLTRAVRIRTLDENASAL